MLLTCPIRQLLRVTDYCQLMRIRFWLFAENVNLPSATGVPMKFVRAIAWQMHLETNIITYIKMFLSMALFYFDKHSTSYLHIAVNIPCLRDVSVTNIHWKVPINGHQCQHSSVSVYWARIWEWESGKNSTLWSITWFHTAIYTKLLPVDNCCDVHCKWQLPQYRTFTNFLWTLSSLRQALI